MDRFKDLFGLPQTDMSKTCVMLPFLPSKILSLLGCPKLSDGAVFSAGTGNNLAVIKTGIGPSYVGDSVLYLKDTACENILLLGTCGLINKKLGLTIGDLVIPTVAYSIESFSDILLGRVQEPVSAHPDSNLLSDFLEITGLPLQRSACISFGSLSHEDEYTPTFKRLGADVIEMECAALFHAARKAGKKALAVLVVADVLGEKSFYEPLNSEEQKKLASGFKTAAQSFLQFADHHQ